MAQVQPVERPAFALGVSGYGLQHIFASIRPVPRMKRAETGNNGRQFHIHTANLYHSGGCVNRERVQSGILPYLY